MINYGFLIQARRENKAKTCRCVNMAHNDIEICQIIRPIETCM